MILNPNQARCSPWSPIPAQMTSNTGPNVIHGKDRQKKKNQKTFQPPPWIKYQNIYELGCCCLNAVPVQVFQVSWLDKLSTFRNFSRNEKRMKSLNCCTRAGVIAWILSHFNANQFCPSFLEIIIPLKRAETITFQASSVLLWSAS